MSAADPYTSSVPVIDKEMFIEAINTSRNNILTIIQYCKQRYNENRNQIGPTLDETKNFTVQTLAAVIDQMNGLCETYREIFDRQENVISGLETDLQLISTIERATQDVKGEKMVFTQTKAKKLLEPIGPKIVRNPNTPSVEGITEVFSIQEYENLGFSFKEYKNQKDSGTLPSDPFVHYQHQLLRKQKEANINVSSIKTAPGKNVLPQVNGLEGGDGIIPIKLQGISTPEKKQTSKGATNTAQTLVNGSLGGQTLVNGSLGGQTLVGGSLGGQTLVGNSLGGQTLVGNSLGGQTLVGGSLAGQTLVGNTGTSFGRTLVGSTVTGTLVNSLGGATLTNNSLGGATLTGNAFGGATLTNNSLGGATLTGNAFGGATLTNNSLGGATLTGNAFGGATLTNNSLGGATLTGNPFGGATLTNNSLGGATLTGSSFGGATLTNNSLGGATLTGNPFGAATLVGSSLLTGDTLVNNQIGGTAAKQPEKKKTTTSNRSSPLVVPFTAKLAFDDPEPSVRVMYDYVANSDIELTIRTNEVLKVINRDAGNGWMECEINGRTGFVPQSYVQDVE